jgi:hypothetical protein
VTPATADAHSVEIGLKFRADANGYVTGVRFYKGATNTGVHTGTLWSSTGQQLATATFSNESATGWQQVDFSTWVPVTANTVYVVSYHAPVGRYALTSNALTNGVDNPPLHALANGASGPNAVFAYAATTTFPTTSANNANYWVDAVYTLSNAAPTVTSSTPVASATGVSTSTAVTAMLGKPVVGSSVNIALTDPTASALDESTSYTVTVSGATDPAGVPMVAPYSYSFTTATSPSCRCTIFTPSTTPVVVSAGDAKAVELGVKFKVDQGGYVTGVRFYKGSTNSGAHVVLGDAARPRDVRGGERVRLAAGELLAAGARPRGRHLRRLVSHERRALFVHGERPGFGCRHPADARARERRARRCERCLPIQRRKRVPDDGRIRDELLRRRGVRRRAAGDSAFAVPRRRQRRDDVDGHRAVQ